LIGAAAVGLAAVVALAIVVTILLIYVGGGSHGITTVTTTP
jgi:hypothetical protein